MRKHKLSLVPPQTELELWTELVSLFCFESASFPSNTEWKAFIFIFFQLCQLFFSLPHLRYAHKDTHFLFSVHRCPSQQKQKRMWLSLACVAVGPCKSFLLLLTVNHTHKDGPFDCVKNVAAKRAKN